MSLNQDNEAFNLKMVKFILKIHNKIISWKAKLDVNAIYAISSLGQAATGLNPLISV
jgi:hypothetical protein